MRRALLPLLLVPILAGCMQEPPVRALEGPTDGYTPTPTFLKLFVKREDGSLAALAFERRDWHVAAIAERVDQRELTFIAAEAKPRATLNEYEPRHVASPADLESLRYDNMDASPEARAEMDAAYERLLLGWAPPIAPERQAEPLIPTPPLP